MGIEALLELFYALYFQPNKLEPDPNNILLLVIN